MYFLFFYIYYYVYIKNYQKKIILLIYNKINYYYISEDEEKIFGEIGKEKKEIIFDKFKFKIEYDNKSENFWDILYS
jgi:hypothetical protein